MTFHLLRELRPQSQTGIVHNSQIIIMWKCAMFKERVPIEKKCNNLTTFAMGYGWSLDFIGFLVWFFCDHFPKTFPSKYANSLCHVALLCVGLFIHFQTNMFNVSTERQDVCLKLFISIFEADKKNRMKRKQT